MVAIVAGLGAAVTFALGTLAGTAATKQIGSAAFTGWMMVVGLVVVLPAVVIGGGPLPDPRALGLMLFVGASTLIGLLIIYSALRDGSVSVVIPIVSAEGAVAAALTWVAGEVPSPAKFFGMLVVVGAMVVLVALSADRSSSSRASDGRSGVMAGVACVLMGAMLFAQGRLGEQVPLAWAVLPARAVTVAFLALPLALRRQLRMNRSCLKLVVFAGLADVVGIGLLVLGSRDDAAVTAVLTSLYSVVAVLLAAWLFGERLRVSQRWAVAALVFGVALVAWSSA